MKWLRGKKTFITAGISVLFSVTDFIAVGDYGIEGIRELFNTVLLPALATTLRLGIGKK